MSYLKIYTTHEIEDDSTDPPFLRFDYDRWEDDPDETYHFEYFYDDDDVYCDPETGEERYAQTEFEQADMDKEYSENIQYIFGWLAAWAEDHPGADWTYGGEHEGGPKPDHEFHRKGYEAYFEQKAFPL